MDKAILTCALNGVLTNPKQHPVPVTPEEMAASAKDAFDAGAADENPRAAPDAKILQGRLNPVSNARLLVQIC